MKRIALVVLLFVVAASSWGCTTVAKRGLTELRGAHGKVVPVRDAAPGFYAGLAGIEIGEVSNTIAPVCPAAMQDLIASALQSAAVQAGEELDGTAPCKVNVDIAFYQEPGGAMAVVGKGALLLGRAAVLDEQSNQAADLLIVVSSKAMRTTSQEMADVFAKLLIGHIRGQGD